jgi:CheY-like chemotaxis protein
MRAAEILIKVSLAPVYDLAHMDLSTSSASTLENTTSTSESITPTFVSFSEGVFAVDQDVPEPSDEDLRKLNILIIEDSAVQKKLIGKLLKSASPSYELSFAENGENALVKIKGANYTHNVIIVDFNISSDVNNLNGAELVEVIRRVLGMNYCVIIGYSSNSAVCKGPFEFAGIGKYTLTLVCV